MKKLKLPKQQEPNDKFLSAGDHVSLLLADHEAAVASLQHEVDAAKLLAFRHQAALHIEKAENALAAKRKNLEDANKARRNLAAKLAERYAISWEETALAPTSGQLRPIPKD